eukprot:COSAG04_NODE_1680_length_5962_cov_2.562170_3_plen_172_part_00
MMEEVLEKKRRALIARKREATVAAERRQPSSQAAESSTPSETTSGTGLDSEQDQWRQPGATAADDGTQSEVRIQVGVSPSDNSAEDDVKRLLNKHAGPVKLCDVVNMLGYRLEPSAKKWFDDRADDFVLDDDGRGKGLFFVSLRAGPLISGPSGSLTIRTGSSKAPQKRPR